MTTDAPKYVIKTPEPHSEKQRAIMEAFVKPGLRSTWVSCGTKFGKSLGAGGCFALAVPRRPGTFWRWIAPVYAQAKNIGMKYVRDMMPRDLITVNKSDMTITIPSIDATMQFMHGQNPEDLEGVACHGLILDECSKLREDVYWSARTTLTQTKGPILAISTPRGKNWFYKQFKDAEDKMNWAIANDKPIEHLAITARTCDNPHVDPAEIEFARKTIPPRLFEQYYLASFIDDSSVFQGYQKCVYGDQEINLTGLRQEIIHRDADQMNVVIGVDWAKQKDWTVFIAIDYEAKPAQVVGYLRFQGVNYTEAIKELIRFSRRYSTVETILHDKTGVGLAIDDQLQLTSLPFRGISFSNAVKAELVTRLIHSIEQRRISFPNIKQLKDEMDIYEMSTTKLGSMVFSAPDGQHDDIVTAMMLANEVMLAYADTGSSVNILEELGNKRSLLESYYMDDADDEMGILLDEIYPIRN